MYSFLYYLGKFLLLIINGPVNIEGAENLPEDQSFVLIAPHNSWLDPVFLALGAYPKRFMFMAKKELFENKLLAWFIKKLHAFPVDRENPQISSIKTPIKVLKQDELNLIIFPTGSRYSDEIKGGATTIARLANRPVVPAIYQGPFSFGKLFTRQQTNVRFGKPFYVERKLEGVDDIQAYYNQKIEQAFKELEK